MTRQPKPPIRPTRATRRVLLALLSGAGNLSGYPISCAAQVGSGRVYTILNQLERAGWAASDWGPETGFGRRRFYRLTARGRYHGLKMLGLEDGDA
jgi:DNA-binding PadR family transcriptional regulator